jgi:hypothetical protein
LVSFFKKFFLGHFISEQTCPVVEADDLTWASPNCFLIHGEGEVILFISSFIKSRNCTIRWYWVFLNCFMKKAHRCLKGRNKYISSIYATIINLIPPRIKNSNIPFLPDIKGKKLGRAMLCVWLTKIAWSVQIVHKNIELLCYCIAPTKHTFWEISWWRRSHHLYQLFYQIQKLHV